MTLPPLVPPVGELDADGLARYSRQLILGEVGVTGQRSLAAARVLVIGAGGLGSPVLLYLAAAGVGTIGVVDFDRVEKSNLHRQVIHSDADIGRPKVDSAADAVAALNPTITVHRHALRLTADTIDELLADYDLVLDGADNFPTRYLVNDACVAAGKPLVWGSVLGFAAQVAVFWDAAPGDEGVQLRDVFPEPPAAGTVPSCAEAGVVGALCAQAGSVMAMEAIKLITGIGRPLLGRVLVIDALAGRWDQVEIRRSSRRPTAPAPVPVPAPPDACGSAVSTTVSLPEAGTMFLLDVRGPDEFAAQRVPGSVNIPLPDLLEGALDGVPNDEPILVICRSGQRAEVAAASLDARGYRDVRVLAGGLLALASESVPAQSPR
ncbi:molybdopterin-synthase adenylyltransferase MoeB [Micropruina sp.]|uniref:molybdopterin-synthase adenylyltransferase MoeB n=1 Tax=Micropruina sp. TaxID=2737536 RepID=UPI0026082690|nr:molybdopterin-synthase adenylyltransferase MoeB [Micropruina sp.]